MHCSRVLLTLLFAGPAFGVLLSGCDQSEANVYQGYIEGEFLYLAAPQAGYLQSLDAPRGTRVSAEQTVFVIAGDPDTQALAEAEARAAAALENLNNLQQPRRTTEIAALQADLRAAEADRRLTRSQLQRREALARNQFVSKDELDNARSADEQARAQVEAAKQRLATYRATYGRRDEVRGAEADYQAALAAVAAKRWAVQRKTVVAPAVGEVSDTYYRPGEWVAAGEPVASLLPDTRRRLRFYVPETAIAGLKPGQSVAARCDGCVAPIRGIIDFIAPQAEYTPPVIYSRSSREKLVFRVEAAAAPEQAQALRPGLPIDVRLAEP
ncbi:MAG: HlyD family secretion protein [Gammaproteobacteria bacterium]